MPSPNEALEKLKEESNYVHQNDDVHELLDRAFQLGRMEQHEKLLELFNQEFPDTSKRWDPEYQYALPVYRLVEGKRERFLQSISSVSPVEGEE